MTPLPEDHSDLARMCGAIDYEERSETHPYWCMFGAALCGLSGMIVAFLIAYSTRSMGWW